MDGNCEEVVQEIVAFVVIGILGAIMLALPIIIFCVMKRKKKNPDKQGIIKDVKVGKGLPHDNEDLFDNIEWPL